MPPQAVVDKLDPRFSDIPRLLGFAAVAAISPRRDNRGAVVLRDGVPQPVLEVTIRGYWYSDRDHGTQYLPKPDAILLQTDGRLLPGWREDTIHLWNRTKEGPGNRHRGQERSGREFLDIPA